MLYLSHMNDQQTPSPAPEQQAPAAPSVEPQQQPAPEQPAAPAPASPEPPPSEQPAPVPTPPAEGPPEQSRVGLWVVTFLIVAVLIGGYILTTRDRGYWPFPENQTDTGAELQEELMR